MALLKGKLTEVPPDAIVLTESEAIKYEAKIIRNWKNKSETFAFLYGPIVLGGASFFTGIFFNSYWRSKLFLHQYGKVSSYLPVCVIPAFFSTVLHSEFVQRDILLQNRQTCPICIELRSSALQSMVGCAFPAILAPVASLALAQSYATYDIPYITKEPGKVIRLIGKMVKPITNLMLAIFVGQALLASTVTYMENKTVLTVNQKLHELEQMLENR